MLYAVIDARVSSTQDMGSDSISSKPDSTLRKGDALPLLTKFKDYAEYATLAYSLNEDEIDDVMRRNGYQLVLSRTSQGSASDHQPAHFMAINTRDKEILVSIRGTATIDDVCFLFFFLSSSINNNTITGSYRHYEPSRADHIHQPST